MGGVSKQAEFFPEMKKHRRPIETIQMMKKRFKNLGRPALGIAFAAAAIQLLVGSSRAAEPRITAVEGKQGMVVSVSPHATRAGLDILKQGGSAVDAAIAVEFALAVVWPEAGNISGGGFMMVHPGDGRRPVCIDYRETAPGAASVAMFTPEDGAHTHKIVGVPGTVRGMSEAHSRYGVLPWKSLLAPAVKLAAEGFEMDRHLCSSINRVLSYDAVKKDERHRELIRVYGQPGGGEWKAGDRLVLKDLAATLQAIAERGADGFYQGPIAEALVAEMKRGDGLISLKDLADYRARTRDAQHGTFRGHDVYGAPPPSSGGVCLIQMLNVLEELNLRSHERFSAPALHLMTETMKRAFRDRATYLGDRDFVEIPRTLTDKAYAKWLAAGISKNRATPSEELAGEIKLAPESPATTHFSVIDSRGMAVSNTTTLESSWGARIVVKGAGFVLNNEMGDFNWFPGRTDRNGKIGTIPNQIAPGKRMLSSQTPTIIAKEGKPVLITGSPGGRTIINTTLQVVLNVLEYGMSVDDAVAVERIHHQWFPDTLLIETFDGRIAPETAESLKALGHKVELRTKGSTQGDAHTIWVDGKTGVYRGAADWRSGGAAMGY